MVIQRSKRHHDQSNESSASAPLFVFRDEIFPYNVQNECLYGEHCVASARRGWHSEIEALFENLSST